MCIFFIVFSIIFIFYTLTIYLVTALFFIFFLSHRDQLHQLSLTMKIPIRYFYYLVRFMGGLGAFCTGLYTTWAIMWAEMDIRSRIIFVYLSLFTGIICSAEGNLLQHPHFSRVGRFLTTCIGRAFFYIFIGGLLLNGVAGWILGIYMIAIGVVNILFQIVFGSRLRKDLASVGMSDPTAVGSQAMENDGGSMGPDPFKATKK